MTKFKSFEDIIAWQKSRALNLKIYQLTDQKGFKHDLILRNQIRRACISISSNIAEGFERETTKEFKRFLYIAKASVGETRSQLYLSFDLGYISKKQFDEFYNEVTDIAKMLSGLIKYLDKLEN